MRSLIYVIRDEVSKQCSPLFISPNDATARRQFREFLSGLKTSYVDYICYALGELDPEGAYPIILNTDNMSSLLETGASVEREMLDKLKIDTETMNHGS